MSSYIHRFWAYLKRNETAKGLFLVAIVILAAVGIWGGIRLALNTEYPVLVVSSGSMCPPNNCTLAVGDLIVIRGQDPRTIQAGPACGVPIGTSKYGSIIVFRDPTRGPDFLIVHRVREVRGNESVGFSFRTQGDANSGCDPVVPFSRVVGVYQFTVPTPYLGSAILAVRNFMYNDSPGEQGPRPQGIVVIVALIIALFAFEVIEPSKKKKKQPSPPAPPSSPVVPAKGEGPPEPDAG